MASLDELDKIAEGLAIRVTVLESKAGGVALEQLADTLFMRVEALEARRLPEVAEQLSARVDAIEGLSESPAKLERLATSLSSRLELLEAAATPDTEVLAKTNAELQATIKKLETDQASLSAAEKLHDQLLLRVEELESKQLVRGRSASRVEMEARSKELETINRGLQERIAAIESQAGVATPADIVASVQGEPGVEQLQVSSLLKRIEQLETQRILSATMREELRTSSNVSDSARLEALEEQLATAELRRRTIEVEFAEYKRTQAGSVQAVDNTEITRLEQEKQELIAQAKESQAKLQSQMSNALAFNQIKQDLEKQNAELSANKLSLEQRNAELTERIVSLEAAIKTGFPAQNQSRGRTASRIQIEEQNTELLHRIALLEHGAGVDNGEEMPTDAHEMIVALLARVETLETQQVLAQTMQEEARISQRDRGETEDKYEIMQRQLAAMEMEKRAIQTDFAQYKQQQIAKDIDSARLVELEAAKQDALSRAQAAQTAHATLQSQLQEFQDRAMQAENALNSNNGANEEKQLLLKENQQLQEELQLAYGSQNNNLMIGQQALLERKMLEEDNSTLKSRVLALERENMQIVDEKKVVELRYEALARDLQTRDLTPLSSSLVSTAKSPRPSGVVRAASGSNPIPSSVKMASVITATPADVSMPFAAYSPTKAKVLAPEEVMRSGRGLVASGGRSGTAHSSSPPRLAAASIPTPSIRTSQGQAPLTYNSLLARAQATSSPGRYPVSQIRRGTSNGAQSPAGMMMMMTAR